MARVDLHNFFKFFDEKNPSHKEAVQWLEDNLPPEFLEGEKTTWVKIFRGQEDDDQDDGPVCPHCGKSLNTSPSPKVEASHDDDEKFDLPMMGIKLVKEFEGCRLNAYPDPLSGNLPITIGWGSTRNKNGQPFKMGDTITQQEADELLIEEARKHFLPALRKIPYWSEMSDGQRGALLSFAYNLGAGFYGGSNFNTITKRLKNKEWDLVPEALYLYRNPGTPVEAGLARRRKAEGEAWKKG